MRGSHQSMCFENAGAGVCAVRERGRSEEVPAAVPLPRCAKLLPTSQSKKGMCGKANVMQLKSSSLPGEKEIW